MVPVIALPRFSAFPLSLIRFMYHKLIVFQFYLSAFSGDNPLKSWRPTP
jgi:hypothetical protein